MQHYRERWAFHHSVDFVPSTMRHLCDDSLNDIFSDAPMAAERELAAAHAALMAAQEKLVRD